MAIFYQFSTVGRRYGAWEVGYNQQGSRLRWSVLSVQFFLKLN